MTAFHRTLEQELTSLLRGASLECLVCGEFVLHEAGAISCPECGVELEVVGLSPLELDLAPQEEDEWEE